MGQWDRFISGSSGYNVVNLVIGVAGLALGVIGLLVAFVQLRKTRTAADQAATSAEAARKEVQAMVAVIAISRLRALANEIALLLRSESYHEAGGKAHDLRSLAAEARTSTSTANLLPPEEWQALLVKIATLHQSLASVKRDMPISTAKSGAWVKSSGHILETFSGLAGTATKRVGA